MKRLLLIAITLATFSMNAQQVTFGIKGGVNFASVSGDETENMDGRTSFHLGGTAEIIISDAFSIQPELLYSGQGYRITEIPGIDGMTFDIKAKLDYLNLPVMAKYYLIEGLSLEAGPQIGVLMRAQFKEEESRDVKDTFNSTDFALNFGAGYKLNSGINFNLRYSLGLTDIPQQDDVDFKQSVFQISVGYNF